VRSLSAKRMFGMVTESSTSCWLTKRGKKCTALAMSFITARPEESVLEGAPGGLLLEAYKTDLR
jgi:hypothetical protein